VDTIISPSFRTAVAQIVQIPGMSGMENNSILFEFEKDDMEGLKDIIDGCEFAAAVGYNICVLRSSAHTFGRRKKIHIWLTSEDYRNASFKIILAYIIMGHPDWKKCETTLFVAFKKDEVDHEAEDLNAMIAQGRIPISHKNVVQVPITEADVFDKLVSERSKDADLVITGFSLNKLKADDGAFLKGFDRIPQILFVRAGQEILITRDTKAP